MPLGIQSLLISAIVASVIAVLSTFIQGDSLGVFIRRLFLVVLNLNPWTVGTWRNDFSKREIFLSTWFLVFIITLIFLTLS